MSEEFVEVYACNCGWVGEKEELQKKDDNFYCLNCNTNLIWSGGICPDEIPIADKLMMLGENGWSWKAYNSYNTPKCKFCIKIIKRGLGQVYGYGDTPEDAMAMIEREIQERVRLVKEIKDEQQKLKEEEKENDK